MPDRERPSTICILELDSPSYPPETDEYRQCGCESCMIEYRRRINYARRP